MTAPESPRSAPKLPDAVHAAPPPGDESSAAALSRLRAEVEHAGDTMRKARLLYEIGELEEQGGNDAEAARDYLAAFNTEPEFHEALEGLARTLGKKRSPTNYGRLLEKLVEAADSPDERARALVARASFLESQGDLEGARGAFRDAIDAQASPNEAAPAWLGLEIVAAKLQDGPLREEALLGRAELSGDPTWRGLLLVDAGHLAEAAGENERAIELFERARALDAGATWLATRALSVCLARSTADDGANRGRRASDVLEAEASLVLDARTSPENGARHGVPRTVPVAHAIERLVTAAGYARLGGDMDHARALLDRAARVLDETEGEREAPSFTRKLVLASRIRIAEIVGDVGAAARDAAAWLPHETDGRLAAALAMRVAEEAASRGAGREALAAVTTATQRDPMCVPARALELDLLADAPDVVPFLDRLEGLEPSFPTAEARGRAALLGAFLSATRARDVDRAKRALERARAATISPETTARLGRSLAKALGDDAFYRDETLRLFGALSPDVAADERLAVAYELLHERVAAKDVEGAKEALARLEGLDDGKEIARLASVFVPSLGSDERTSAAVAELDGGAQGTDDARTFGLVSALLAAARGQGEAAVARARALADEEPTDPFSAYLYADLARRFGAHETDVASTLEGAARSMADAPLAAAMHLEAAFLRARVGRFAEAQVAFRAAKELDSAAEVAHAWAERTQNLEAPDARRAALDAAEERLGSGEWLLERAANAIAADDLPEARRALERAEEVDHEAIPLAAALAVLGSADADTDADAMDRALRRVALLGPEGSLFAAGERARLARDLGHDDLAEAAGSWFAAGGGLGAGVEWLSAAMAAGDGMREVTAREALAEALQDEAREGVAASARLFDRVLDARTPKALVSGTSHAVRLANLELSPPGSDPRRRAAALDRLGNALGEDTDADVAALSAWSTYYAGDKRAAFDLFRSATAARAGDLGSWEGVRTCAHELNDLTTFAVASEQLGSRMANAARAAVHWEQAGLSWLELGQEQRAEAALDQAIYRDPGRLVAFDKLFRRVRDRKDSDKVLDLVERRLGHTDDSEEVARLYWEQSRALREKGDLDGALYALENVQTIDPDHVGALALMGEIYIRRGRYEEAASYLSRLAHVEGAPAKNRITAGVAAVDLYENKLSRQDLALGVLLTLHRAKISTLPVRERLARAAARTGSWEPASSILEELMVERDSREGRIEAARLAMVIYRDRLKAPSRGVKAVTKLLDESPTDGEGIDFLVEHDIEREARLRLLDRARTSLLEALRREPGTPAHAKRLARVTRSLGEPVLEHAALSVALATNGPDGSLEQMLAQLSANKPRTPQLAMTDALLKRVLAPGDDGPLAQLFGLLGPTIAEALGPTLSALGVTKKERVDPRSGLALRNEIAAWAGAFGIADFELYVGGKDPTAVQGVPGEVPALVVGTGVMAPLSPQIRSRVARELLSIVRGTVVTRWRDDTTIAAIAVAACNIVEVRMASPPYAILAEVERALSKAISRKTKKAIEPVCQALAQQPRDAKTWVPRAIASQHRVSAIASGDASVVLADAFGLSLQDLPRVAREDLRCADLLRFVLSPDYFDIRRLLGLEASA